MSEKPLYGLDLSSPAVASSQPVYPSRPLGTPLQPVIPRSLRSR